MVPISVRDMRPVARDGCPVNRDALTVFQRGGVRGRAVRHWKGNGVSYTLIPLRSAGGVNTRRESSEELAA